MRVIISVTQEDINKGVAGACFECPIALAIQRELNDSDIEVGPFSWFRNNKWAGKLPWEAQKFIAKFDTRHTTSPFSFELEVRE